MEAEKYSLRQAKLSRKSKWVIVKSKCILESEFIFKIRAILWQSNNGTDLNLLILHYPNVFELLYTKGVWIKASLGSMITPVAEDAVGLMRITTYNYRWLEVLFNPKYKCFGVLIMMKWHRQLIWISARVWPKSHILPMEVKSALFTLIASLLLGTIENYAF